MLCCLVQSVLFYVKMSCQYTLSLPDCISEVQFLKIEIIIRGQIVLRAPVKQINSWNVSSKRHEGFIFFAFPCTLWIQRVKASASQWKHLWVLNANSTCATTFLIWSNHLALEMNVWALTQLEKVCRDHPYKHCYRWIVCIHGRIRSFKRGYQMEDFFPFPSRSHQFFIPTPNRPSHLPLPSFHPLYLYSSSLLFLSPSRTSYTIPSFTLHFLLLSHFSLPPMSFDFLCPLVLYSSLLFIPSSILVLSGGLWHW